MAEPKTLPNDTGADDEHVTMTHQVVEDVEWQAGPAPLSRSRRIFLLTALAIVVFLAALDQTIVATALNQIGADLQGTSSIPWIGTAYLLTSTAFCSCYGSFADIFGRKLILLSAISIFAIGSLLCGIAKSMVVLILGRAIAGIGGGGLITLVLIIIADITAPADRARYQGLMGGVFGLGAVVGPLAGGALTEHASWRWCFYLNLPICGVSVAVLAVLLSGKAADGSMSSKLRRIHYTGIALLTAGCVCLLLPLQMGGNQWLWKSAQTVTLLIVGALIMAVCAWSTTTVPEPIISPRLFTNRKAVALLLVSFCLGATFYAEVFYVPTFFEVVHGVSATSAGAESLPLILSVVFASMVSGHIISKTNVILVFPFIGAVLSTIGLGLMSTMDADSARWKFMLYLIIAGLGSGCVVQTAIVGIQASVEADMLAVATSAIAFIQMLGGVFGIALSGTVYSTVLQHCLASNAPSVEPSQAQSSSFRKLPEGLQGPLENCFTQAIQKTFLLLVPFAGVMFIIMLLALEPRAGRASR
ncbi:hypothetical protein HDU87_006658 [Geranomyces variabilis]|uniref:Major facilitator superfamily (MFS) profile domain-containing protein n=1 Tax=Geranomyces variabilis TaxID=109894 RepID=A0AAD5TGK6_9FUNG|nr:hypothetical protein HDU87_006658 [Geranomyces variabilis]